jgi:WS/DGAT/MGAT family acyltransferase
LLEAVEQLRRRPLDRARPLWGMWLLPGLSDGRTGCYLKMHHAIADGVSGIAMLATLLDDRSHPRERRVTAFAHVPVPSGHELAVDNLRRRWRGLVRFVAACGHPASAVRRMAAGWPAVHETLGAPAAPRTSLNTPIGSGRVYALVRSRLDALRAVGHECDATVNDVLLAAVAGGLRDLLLARGERVDGVALRAYVPVSLHREARDVARGNRTGVMAVNLPVGVPDALVRLRLITAETTERKHRARPPAGALLRNSLIQRTMLPLMARQRWANVYVVNVSGPTAPLYLAGTRVEQLFPLVPLLGNITLGVGALSYAGEIAVAAVGDRDACPDIDVFANGLRGALDSLTRVPVP